MDLKLLLSPAQKDPEPDSASAHHREDDATGDRPHWQYRLEEHPYDQPQQQRHEDHGHQHDRSYEPYQQGQQHGRPSNQDQQHYYAHQEHASQRKLRDEFAFTSILSDMQPIEAEYCPCSFVSFLLVLILFNLP